MNKKQIIKITGILLLLLLSVTILTGILSSKWKKPCYDTRVQKEFYELEKDTIEVCLLGSSQVVYGVSCMNLMEEYGISAYSLGSTKQPLIASLAWLQECRKTQDISTVILDTSMLFEDTEEARYHVAFDNMKLSRNKIQAIYEHCKMRDNADPFMSYFIKIIKYHSRWSELTEDDFTYDAQDMPVFRGNVISSSTKKMDLYDIAYDHDKYNENLRMQEYQQLYFEKLVQYCKEEGLNLVLIKTPKNNWSITKHILVEEYAQENDLPFLDFSSEAMMSEIGLDINTDFLDGEHLNLFGARKLTTYLGEYLKEHYNLTDYREIDGYVNPGYDRYLEYVKDCELQVCSDIPDYFQAMKDDRYEIILQITSNLSGKYDSEQKEVLTGLGIRSYLNNLGNLRFTACIHNGENLYENVAENDITYQGSFSDGTQYLLTSSPSKNVKASVQVDHKNYTFSQKGLNILVYDSIHGCIVDRASIYEDTENGQLKLAHETK